MGEIYFSSDHHFYHVKIRDFHPIPRASYSIEDMNERIIKAHNSKVRVNHIVYFLGDFSFGNEEQTLKIVKRLNGQKHLILGNHDKVIKNSSLIQAEFESVQDYKVVKFNKERIVLSHFPFRQWEGMHKGSYHLYGHCHNSIENIPYGKSMDVGIETRDDYAPWSFSEIHRKLKNRETLSHHDRPN